MSAKRVVFVVGSNGKVGQKLLQKLATAQDQFVPISLVRQKEQQQKFEKLGITSKLFDIATTSVNDIIDKLFKPYNSDTVPTTVVFSAGAGGSGDGNIINVDLDGPFKFVEAIESFNSKIQFVIVSALYSLDRTFWEGGSLNNYYVAKLIADLFVLQSKLENYVVLQPGLLLDGEGTGKIKSQNEIPTSEEAKKIPHEDSAIFRDDVAKFIVSILKDKSNHNNKQVVSLVNGAHPIN